MFTRHFSDCRMVLHVKLNGRMNMIIQTIDKQTFTHELRSMSVFSYEAAEYLYEYFEGHSGDENYEFDPVAIRGQFTEVGANEVVPYFWEQYDIVAHTADEVVEQLNLLGQHAVKLENGNVLYAEF